MTFSGMMVEGFGLWSLVFGFWSLVFQLCTLYFALLPNVE